MWLIGAIVLSLPSLVMAAAPAPAGRATRAAVETRLRAHEVSTAADWKAVGARADEVLVEIAGDGRADFSLRGRAVTALGFLPTAASRRFLEGTIDGAARVTGDEKGRVLLRKAAVALGWAGGTGVPARLAPLLEHADPDVRLDAAIGLGLTRLPAAADHLRQRLAAETVARVRKQIERQVLVIENAVAEAGRSAPAGSTGAAGPSSTPVSPPKQAAPTTPPRGH
jgi:HEAT repeat protein